MEKQLEKYRSQKRRIEVYETFKAKFWKAVSFRQNMKKNEDNEHIIQMSDDQRVPDISRIDDKSDASNDEAFEDIDEILETPKQKRTMLDYLTYFAYFLFYVTLYAIAIQLKFGTVYFMLSLLFFIYFLGTRTGPKQKNEPSAYSVFNPNVESIDGTLKAEQFEREIGIART